MAGHVRRMPRLTHGPFRYRRYADKFLEQALRHSTVPVKQAVISPSALEPHVSRQMASPTTRANSSSKTSSTNTSPRSGVVSRWVRIPCRSISPKRASRIKLDPTGALLASFIDLNNLALSRLTAAERLRVGVHTCPGGDRDSTHSADVPYSALLPSLFQLNVTNFFRRVAGRARPGVGARNHGRAAQTRAACVRGRDLTDRSAPRERRGGSRPRSRSGALHSRGSARHHGRLWLRAFLRRPVDVARAGIRQNPCAGCRHGARGKDIGHGRR